MSDSESRGLPPYPNAFKPYTLDETQERYPFKSTDFAKRIQFKLYAVWKLYGYLVESKKLGELLNKIPSDFTSDEYHAKNLIVDILDKISKILSDTPLIEELNWLCDHTHENEEESCELNKD